MVALVIVLAVAGSTFYFQTATEATQEPALTAAFDWTTERQRSDDHAPGW